MEHDSSHMACAPVTWPWAYVTPSGLGSKTDRRKTTKRGREVSGSSGTSYPSSRKGGMGGLRADRGCECIEPQPDHMPLPLGPDPPNRTRCAMSRGLFCRHAASQSLAHTTTSLDKERIED